MRKQVMADEEKNAGLPEGDGANPPNELPRNPNMKWYIIHSYSGFERKVKESLESRVQAFGLQEKIGRVLIPTESVTEVRAEREGIVAALPHRPLVNAGDRVAYLG